MNGVTLLAIGNKTYGEWAFNMALSIKYHNKDIPIQLVYDPETLKSLNDWHRSFFDVMTIMNPDHYTYEKRFNPAWAKINIYKYTHFDKSLCLDVDAVCLKDLSPIFDEKGYKVQTKGYMTRRAWPDDVEIWVHPNKIWERYDLDEKAEMPIVETGIQLIPSDDSTNNIFFFATNLFKNAIPIDELNSGGWGWNQPDELYLGIAMAMLDYKPDFPESIKSLHATYKAKIVNEMEYLEPYYCYGLWGNKALNHSRLIDLYDRLMAKYAKSHNQNIQFKARKMLNDKFVKINKKHK